MEKEIKVNFPIRLLTVLVFSACVSFGEYSLAGADKPPGVVVSHSPHVSGVYYGSPSVLAVDSDVYLVSHDEYGPNVSPSSRSTHVYRSADAGETWERIARIGDVGLHWSNLFALNSNKYLFGADKYGNTVILKSEDEGWTWTRPLDEHTGLLKEGSYHPLSPGVLVHNGRVWRANEYARPGERWGSNFEAFVMSAPVDSDLLISESWILSNRIGYNAEWLEGRFGGWLEGNAVVTPDGAVVNMLRVQFGANRFNSTWSGYDGVGKAAIHEITDDGEVAAFDSETGFIEFPGGLVRFQIQRDPETGYYWSLTSFVPPIHRDAKSISDRIRNTVALVRSTDLRTWEIRTVVLYEPDPFRFGFQYLSWQFDGDDMVAVSRTSYPDETSADVGFGIDQAHDANYITFHRFENFRELTLENSVVNPRDLGMIVESSNRPY